MDIISLGKKTVTTAGTPIPLSATSVKCHKIIVSQIPGTTGTTYFGKSTLVKATGVGVLRYFVAPTASGMLDFWEIVSPDGNQLDLAEYYVDANVNAEGLQAAYAVK